MNEYDHDIINPEEYQNLRAKYADLVKSNDVLRHRIAQLDTEIEELRKVNDGLVLTNTGHASHIGQLAKEIYNLRVVDESWQQEKESLKGLLVDEAKRNAELEELTRQPSPARLTTREAELDDRLENLVAERNAVRAEQQAAEHRANAFQRIAQGYEMLWKGSIL